MYNHFLSRFVIIAFLASFAVLPVFTDVIHANRQPMNDVEKVAGRSLSEDEKKIAEYVFSFYCKKYGYSKIDTDMDTAAEKMNDEEYENTVKQAAKVAKSPVAKGLLATGKGGEKILKALIVTIEDGAHATGQWIEKKSDEYDKRNQDVR